MEKRATSMRAASFGLADDDRAVCRAREASLVARDRGIDPPAGRAVAVRLR
jgi:hypothetical protein